MRAQITAITLAWLIAGSPAHADFIITSQPQWPTTASEREFPDAPDKPVPTRHLVPQPVTSPGFPIARGFGIHVPLRFAVLQIVPQGTHVSYGVGVNPEATVDWTGGQGWDRVLARAITPLHLRLIITPHGLTIRR